MVHLVSDGQQAPFDTARQAPNPTVKCHEGKVVQRLNMPQRVVLMARDLRARHRAESCEGAMLAHRRSKTTLSKQGTPLFDRHEGELLQV